MDRAKMIPVYQTIVYKDTRKKGKIPGDCLRAGVASLFELEIIQVPHFLLFDREWFHILWSFVGWLGYDMHYEYYVNSDGKFSRKNLVNGCIMASVPSRTIKGGTHLVLVNSIGRVLHDPNPNKRWLEENVVQPETVIGWYCLEKKGT